MYIEGGNKPTPYPPTPYPPSAKLTLALYARARTQTLSEREPNQWTKAFKKNYISNFKKERHEPNFLSPLLRIHLLFSDAHRSPTRARARARGPPVAHYP
jgi:hypothetical protein